jgi:hypothetical protein
MAGQKGREIADFAGFAVPESADQGAMTPKKLCGHGNAIKA